MIRAAGIAMICRETGRALFVRRGPGSDFPGYWHFSGGRLEADETPEEAAERETAEEAGGCPHDLPQLLTVAIDADRSDGEVVEYTTFRAECANEFRAVLNWENTAWCWAPPSDPPQPMHPGCLKALEKMTGLTPAEQAVNFQAAVEWNQDYSDKIDAAFAATDALMRRADIFK